MKSLFTSSASKPCFIIAALSLLPGMKLGSTRIAASTNSALSVSATKKAHIINGTFVTLLSSNPSTNNTFRITAMITAITILPFLLFLITLSQASYMSLDLLSASILSKCAARFFSSAILVRGSGLSLRLKCAFLLLIDPPAHYTLPTP